MLFFLQIRGDNRTRASQNSNLHPSLYQPSHMPFPSSFQGVFPLRPAVQHPDEVYRRPDTNAQPQGTKISQLDADHEGLQGRSGFRDFVFPPGNSLCVLQVKVAILKYIESLARQMDPTDFVNSSETRLAVSRIITWTTEPKSSDVRKVRRSLP